APPVDLVATGATAQTSDNAGIPVQRTARRKEQRAMEVIRASDGRVGDGEHRQDAGWQWFQDKSSSALRPASSEETQLLFGPGKRSERAWEGPPSVAARPAVRLAADEGVDP